MALRGLKLTRKKGDKGISLFSGDKDGVRIGWRNMTFKSSLGDFYACTSITALVPFISDLGASCNAMCMCV